MEDREKKRSDIHKRAVALRYDPDDTAPKVVATGRGYTAERMLELAQEHEIPTYYNPELAEELSKIDIGNNIPPELYEVVAQVLVFIGNLDKHKQRLDEVRHANRMSYNYITKHSTS